MREATCWLMSSDEGTAGLPLACGFREGKSDANEEYKTARVSADTAAKGNQQNMTSACARVRAALSVSWCIKRPGLSPTAGGGEPMHHLPLRDPTATGPSHSGPA